MNCKDFNKRITLTKVERASSCLEDDNWIDFKTIWAKVADSKGNEVDVAQSKHSKLSKKILIRYMKDIDPDINPSATIDFRLKYKNQTYNILSCVNINQSNKFMELNIVNI